MANFCGGDFYCLPQPSTGRGRAQANFTGGAGGKKQPQGVSQWGRQQLAYPAAPAGHGHSGTGMGGPGAGRGRGRSGRGGGQFQQETQSAVPNRTAIQDLSPHLANTSVAGVIITKHSICSFPDKRNPGAERFKFTFTLRDSPDNYVNVTCWASALGYITKLHGSFKICDVVEIVNGQILSKSGGEAEEKWNAWTPTPYLINVSENYSTVSLYSGPNYPELSSLVHAPLRPVRDCHALSGIVANRQSVEGTHVSLMAAIRHVGRPKEMTSKRGKQLKKCEVKLMDRDCSSFSLLIWDEELIELAQTWTPKENIILAVDVKATYDTYRNCMSAVCDQKTLIITNPDCAEAYQLYQFSQSVELVPEESDHDPAFDTIASGSPADNIQSISDVYTIEELKGRQEVSKAVVSGSTWEETAIGMSQSSFTGIVYAYLTQLNITEDSSAVVCYRCAVCKFRVPTTLTDTTVCSNKSCPSHTSGPSLPSTSSYMGTSLTASDLAKWDNEGGAGRRLTAVPDFNLLISLSDYTGELEGVWLGGQAAKDLLNTSPEEYLAKNEEQKIAVKNRLILEKFKIYFKSGVCQGDQKRPPLKVLSMSHADPMEMVSHMQVM